MEKLIEKWIDYDEDQLEQKLHNRIPGVSASDVIKEHIKQRPITGNVSSYVKWTGKGFVEISKEEWEKQFIFNKTKDEQAN